VRLCPRRDRCTLDPTPARLPVAATPEHQGVKRLSSPHRPRYTPEQSARLLSIRERLVEARRELDALIGDAYLRPRANIVPVHFLDLASAVEKLRWAEKEWRDLDREIAAHDECHRDRLLEVAPAEASGR
jgi:hypothetical protein